MVVAITARDPAAEKADQMQSKLHEGPGLVAVAEAGTIVVHDTAADLRWPRWAAGMRDLTWEVCWRGGFGPPNQRAAH
jgi:hypothetical protein